MKDMVKEYYSLAKTGLVLGNVISVVGGFALGSPGAIDPGRLLATAAGIALVMASGCVFNNYLDRDIDAKMPRTKDRALAAGRVSPRAALWYGTALGFAGFLILAAWTNLLAADVAFLGFLVYVWAYTQWSKRQSPAGTFIGAIAGATPPVVGYAAAGGRLDIAALLLFLILVLWQLPHFFAIAIRRREEYAAAGIPVLPVARGVAATKIVMLASVGGFTVVAPLLAPPGYAGLPYFWTAVLLGLGWLAAGLFGIRAADEKRWARTMFVISLAVLVLLFAAMTASAIFLKG
ncbi:MAG TPA: heme o synthase [Candidatus Paceibacterota bacterium]|nr:heme o synthase [Candidatus Paceibacterota bacterium]